VPREVHDPQTQVRRIPALTRASSTPTQTKAAISARLPRGQRRRSINAPFSTSSSGGDRYTDVKRRSNRSTGQCCSGTIRPDPACLTAKAQWPPGTIFTVGHSTLPIERFTALLQTYAIERVADVRTIPRSRHNPQFDADALGPALKADSIEYGLHMERLRGGETFKRWLTPCLSTFR
jgi:uncharacterized protein DUF488